jgi:hypothetical protein
VSEIKEEIFGDGSDPSVEDDGTNWSSTNAVKK